MDNTNEFTNEDKMRWLIRRTVPRKANGACVSLEVLSKESGVSRRYIDQETRRIAEIIGIKIPDNALITTLRPD